MMPTTCGLQNLTVCYEASFGCNCEVLQNGVVYTYYYTGSPIDQLSTASEPVFARKKYINVYVWVL